MIQSSTYKDNDQNSIGNGHQNNNNRHRNRNRRERNGSIDEDYEPSTSYFRSFCRSCFTFQHFCYVVQFINCGLVCGLIYLALIEYPKIEALEAQVEEDKKEIADLDEEVREKQEGQIQILHKAVEQEQQFNFLTLAGTFTLLTCLISMFHMTTHVHRFTQPKIQRKIIAILWMSPIYSVTSFLSLIFPSVEGWMAIIKDFYESYCIYVFLSFLIAVLGEGSRDKAVEVLAKHAGHLDRPTRCLTCFYDPPPDTSDLAKANAVMTQCQIYCLQFTLVRPLTTIFSVFVLRRGKHHLEEDEDYNEDDEFNDDTYDFNNDDNTIETDGDIDSNNENNNQKNTTDVKADESSPTDASMGEEPITDSSSPQFGNATSTSNPTSDGNDDNGGTRMLQDAQNKRLRRKRTQTRQDRWLQQEQAGEEEEDTTEMSTNPSIESSINDNDGNIPPMGFPSIAPVSEGDGYQFPTFLTPTIPIEGMPIGSSPFAPSFASSNTNGFVPTFDPISGVIPGPENDAASSFDYNSTGLNGIFDTNSTSNFTMAPSLPDVVNDTGFDSSELVDQTKAYFKSPGFALAMIVNVSIFFAFTGLLKLYHAVREDLLWCRPFPKFLTIKAVVFLTFWQGLAILLWLILTAEPGEKEEAFLQAHKYQNLLICVEMLLVAISQWCVFPAIEWEPDYVPRQMHTPGLGIKDFVSDVGQIVQNRSGRSRKGKKAARRRKKRGGPNSNKAGLYHMPGFASIMSSQYDDFGGPAGGARADDTFHDDECENSCHDSSVNKSFDSYDGSITDDRDQFTIDDENDADSKTRRFKDNLGVNDQDMEIITNGLPSSDRQANIERIRSDGTSSSYSVDNEVSNDDIEML